MTNVQWEAADLSGWPCTWPDSELTPALALIRCRYTWLVFLPRQHLHKHVVFLSFKAESLFIKENQNGWNPDFCLIHGLLRSCEFTNMVCEATHPLVHKSFIFPTFPLFPHHECPPSSLKHVILQLTFSSKHLQMGWQSAGITDHHHAEEQCNWTRIPAVSFDL